MNPEVFHALVFWLPAFLFSITVHEASHAWAAMRLGDPTAYLGGQVSLSPWPHMKRSPIGMIVVPILTTITQGWPIGWASAPYDVEWAAHHPRHAAWMAAAGPASNLLLAASALLLIHLGLTLGAFAPPDTISFQSLVVPAGPADPATFVDFAAQMLSTLLALNSLLFAFNLLPLPPLDGASVITLLLPADAARAWRGFANSPMLGFVGIFAAWKLFPVLLSPMFAALVALLYPGQFTTR